MQAIEFIAHAKNGVIKVPKEHLDKLHASLRVIILLDQIDNKKTKPSKKTLSKRIQLDTKNFKFDRNEANKR